MMVTGWGVWGRRGAHGERSEPPFLRAAGEKILSQNHHFTENLTKRVGMLIAHQLRKYVYHECALRFARRPLLLHVLVLQPRLLLHAG